MIHLSDLLRPVTLTLHITLTTPDLWKRTWTQRLREAITPASEPCSESFNSPFDFHPHRRRVRSTLTYLRSFDKTTPTIGRKWNLRHRNPVPGLMGTTECSLCSYFRVQSTLSGVLLTSHIRRMWITGIEWKPKLTYWTVFLFYRLLNSHALTGFRVCAKIVALVTLRFHSSMSV